MPPTLTEINDTFRRLSDSLLSAKLDWLLDQILEHLRLGKAATTRVKEMQERPGRNDRLLRKIDDLFTPGPLREYPTTIEYSPQERIAVLLSAVEEVVVRVPEMQDSVSQHFPNCRFVGEGEPSVISKRTEAQIVSSAKFKHLIDAIRREVGIDVNQ